MGDNVWAVVPITNDIRDNDRNTLLMTVLFGLSCHLYVQFERVPRFLKQTGADFCTLVLCSVIYFVLLWHLLGWLFAGRYQPPVAPEWTLFDHFRVYLKRWWRVVRFLYRHYAILWAQWLLRLARAKSINEVRKYLGYGAIWDEEDALWLRDLNIILYQQLEYINQGEMLPLDRNRGLYLDFEDFRFPDFWRFLDRVSGTLTLFVDSYNQIGRCKPGS
jgi:hypothetical protein